MHRPPSTHCRRIELKTRQLIAKTNYLDRWSISAYTIDNSEIDFHYFRAVFRSLFKGSKSVANRSTPELWRWTSMHHNPTQIGFNRIRHLTVSCFAILLRSACTVYATHASIGRTIDIQKMHEPGVSTTSSIISIQSFIHSLPEFLYISWDDEIRTWMWHTHTHSNSRYVLYVNLWFTRFNWLICRRECVMSASAYLTFAFVMQS